MKAAISGGGGTAMAGNVLLGGIIGAGVDASNGSMNELSPNPLHAVMEVEEGVRNCGACKPHKGSVVILQLQL